MSPRDAEQAVPAAQGAPAVARHSSQGRSIGLTVNLEEEHCAVASTNSKGLAMVKKKLGFESLSEAATSSLEQQQLTHKMRMNTQLMF